MPTIYDVARRANVSPKTVSRVLNGEGPVGPAKRQAVEAAIQDLNFVPSSAARMMRSRRSGLIGLITGAISPRREPDQPSGLPDLLIVQGIQAGLADSGKTLMIADTAGRMDRVPGLIATFLRHRVEGLIYVAEFHQRVALPDRPAGTPMVLANCFDDQDTPAILPDDRACQRDLVRRLIAAGHRRIAHLALRPDIEAGRLRPAGYRDALAEAGITHDPALEIPCDVDAPDGGVGLLEETIRRMLRLGNPPTVLACGNDKMALRASGILRSMGLHVPGDISVAGFDNYTIIAETMVPPLTTVDLPYHVLGTTAAAVLMGLISGDRGSPDPVLVPVLVPGPVRWRGSVDVIPAGHRAKGS